MTETTLPSGGEESVALRHSAAPNEFRGGGFGRWARICVLFAALPYIANAAIETCTLLLNGAKFLVHLGLHGPVFLGKSLIVLGHIAGLEFSFGHDLIGRQEALFAIHEHSLPMQIIGLVQEGVRTNGV